MPETLLIHLDEALEVVGKSPVEDRAFWTAWTIDVRTRSCCDRLHPEGEDEIDGRELAVESRQQSSDDYKNALTITSDMSPFSVVPPVAFRREMRHPFPTGPRSRQRFRFGSERRPDRAVTMVCNVV